MTHFVTSLILDDDYSGLICESMSLRVGMDKNDAVPCRQVLLLPQPVNRIINSRLFVTSSSFIIGIDETMTVAHNAQAPRSFRSLRDRENWAVWVIFCDQ